MTDTGRIKKDWKPNIQNIPIRTEIGEKIRKEFLKWTLIKQPV